MEAIVNVFEDTNHVRTVELEGQVWFASVDVCSVLEISNSRDAVTKLDDDEKATVGITDSALYCLVSRTTQA